MGSNVYFENLQSIGNLMLEHIFLEFEGEPILFTCKDERNELYLCFCSDFRIIQKWVVAKTTIDILKELENKEMDLVTALTTNENVHLAIRGPKSSETSRIVLSKDLDELDLPNKNTFLCCDESKNIY